MDRWTVVYYTSPSGVNPIKDFLDARPTAKLKAFRILSHIQEFGLLAATPHTKKLTGTPLWEIRILGQDSVRILYMIQTSKQVLLLHIFNKKSNKTPPKEINVALARLAEINN